VRVVTYRRVEYKNPGMGGIFPALLLEGRSIVPYLVRIFRTCLATGYVPARWRQVNVVFIHKPIGVPIADLGILDLSLTSFLLKTMERLVDSFLMEEVLALLSLQPNQHAYQAGKSVVMVLHQLVIRGEEALASRSKLWVFY